MNKTLKSCIIIFLVIIGLCIGGVVVMFITNLCPPQGPWPMPPWCSADSTTPGASPTESSMETAPLTEPSTTAVPITLEIILTVPYWTEGSVYLGLDDNPTYAEMSQIRPVLYQATVTLPSDAEYYYTRGSLETRSTNTLQVEEIPQGLDHVVDWVDSTHAVDLPDFQKGVIFNGMHWDPQQLAIPGIIDYNLDLARASGVEWIGLVNTWFVSPDCRTGTEIAPYYLDDGPWPDTQGWAYPSLTDDQMMEIIQKAHEREMHVFLKPSLVSLFYGPDVPWQCGGAQPTDWNAWYESFAQMAIYNARFAEANGVEMFAIGSELDSSAMYAHSMGPSDSTQHWRDIIAAVRQEYAGKLTVSFACFIPDPKNWNSFPCHGPKAIRFWDAVDYIGFEPYFPITQSMDPTQDELSQNFGEMLDSAAYTYARQLFETYGKPVIFTELSFHSFDGSNLYQLGSPASPTLDLVEQAEQYEAMFQAIETRSWIQGAYPWAWYLANPGDAMQWQMQDTDGPFIGKPAGQVIAKWYLKINLP